MPEKPANLPSAPKNGFFIFGDETRASGGPKDLKGINQLWLALGAEGQKKYKEQAEEAASKYAADLKAFQSSIEGKKYLRLKAVAEKRAKLVSAKKKFLGGANQPQEPKRPLSSYFIFLGEKGSEHTDLPMKEKSKLLTAQWSNLSKEEKSVYEGKAKEMKAKYEEEMTVYRNSPGYKAYARTLASVSGSQQKRVAVAKAKANLG